MKSSWRQPTGLLHQIFSGQEVFGTVYKRTIAGDLVAVKQLKIGSRQGEKEFRAEVDSISRVHHRHLVSLVGHCISDSHKLLVYNFVPNGTLYEALHGTGKPVMGWNMRMDTALGIAWGLAYLHLILYLLYIYASY
ncbi:unnamed protein product [Calypogeia fissa]